MSGGASWGRGRLARLPAPAILLAALAGPPALGGPPALAAEPSVPTPPTVLRLTVEDAVARAYEAHPDVVAADARVRKALLAVEDLETQRHAVTSEVGGRLFGTQGGLFSLSATPSAVSGPDVLAAGSVGITVPLFTGFRLTESIRSATWESEATMADREASRMALALDTVKAFWSARQAALAVDIQQASVDQAGRALEIARAGKRAGRQSEHDVEQAEASHVSAQAELLRQVGARAAAQIQLHHLSGLPPDAVVELAGDPPATPPTFAGPGPAEVDAALARRADVRAARARVAQAEAAIGAARGDYWPQLSLSASYQHGNNLFDQRSGARGLGEMAGQWEAFLSAKYNLFDLGKTRRGVERAEQDLREARAQLDKTLRRLRADIDSAAVRASFAVSRLAFGDRAVELAARNFRWTLARKEQGYGLAIEVDDARSRLAVAETQRLNARIEYLVAMAELRAALGTL